MKRARLRIYFNIFVACSLAFIYYAPCYHTHKALMFIFKDVDLVDRH